jgi:hypothetical protein
MEKWLQMQLGWEMSRIRCGKDRKQVDLVKGNIWIEADGFYHFNENPHGKKRPLVIVQQRDAMLNKEAIRRKNVMLLRLGMDCFASSTGAMKIEWWEIVQHMLQFPIPGVWCLGKLYELCPWVNDKCMILKLPQLPIIFSCPTA